MTKPSRFEELPVRPAGRWASAPTSRVRRVASPVPLHPRAWQATRYGGNVAPVRWTFVLLAPLIGYAGRAPGRDLSLVPGAVHAGPDGNRIDVSVPRTGPGHAVAAVRGVGCRLAHP